MLLAAQPLKDLYDCFPHLSTAGRREILDLCGVATGMAGWYSIQYERDCNTEWDWFSALGHTVLTGTGGFGRNTRLFLTLAQL